MLKRVAIALGVFCCMLMIGGAVSAAWTDARGNFSGQYILYGGYPDKESARAPSPGDTKIAFSITGSAAKDMFNAIGPAPREMSRGEERCEKNPKIRTRAIDTIWCRYHPKDGYWCVFGFDLSTGLATWGKTGDAMCD
jgi:hypothetical protein